MLSHCYAVQTPLWQATTQPCFFGVRECSAPRPCLGHGRDLDQRLDSMDATSLLQRALTLSSVETSQSMAADPEETSSLIVIHEGSRDVGCHILQAWGDQAKKQL